MTSTMRSRPRSVMGVLLVFSLVSMMAGCKPTVQAPVRSGPAPEYEPEASPATSATAPGSPSLPPAMASAAPANTLAPAASSPSMPAPSPRQVELSAAFASVNADFRACYEAELVKSPAAKGRVLLRVVISDVGVVTESRAVPGHPFSTEFEACATAIPRRLKFGKATEPVLVTQPLNFTHP